MKNLIKMIILLIVMFPLLLLLSGWFNVFMSMMFNIHLNWIISLIITTIIMGAVFWAYKGGQR